jgi:hypothetical protein
MCEDIEPAELRMCVIHRPLHGACIRNIRLPAERTLRVELVYSIICIDDANACPSSYEVFGHCATNAACGTSYQDTLSLQIRGVVHGGFRILQLWPARNSLETGGQGSEDCRTTESKTA